MPADPEDIEALFKEEYFGDDEAPGLDSEAFRRFLDRPSKLEQWLRGLPVPKLLAMCLESAFEIIPGAADPLRIVCGLDQQAIEQAINVAVHGFCEGLKRLLCERVKELKECYSALDKRAADNSGSSGANPKFQTIAMSAGKVEDFHKGLTDRVGELPSRARR